jgi:hypothetical protein
MLLLIALLLGVDAHAQDYTTHIGDAFPYRASAIAVDVAGNAYVAGSRTIFSDGLAAGLCPTPSSRS